MKKLLIGCGVAVAVVLVLLVGAGVFVSRWVQEKLPEAERLESLERALLERHGDAHDWVPPLDGVYDADRIARYVQIREAIDPLGRDVARRFTELARSDRPEHKGLRGMIGGTREVFDVIRTGLGLLALADSLLLEADLGKGEFTHYNLLTVHGVFGVQIDHYLDELEDPEGQGDTRRALREMLVDYEDEARNLLRAHAGNALREIDSSSFEAPSEAWREMLVAASQRGKDRLPLTDPVPPGFLHAIEPWRSTLELSRPHEVGDLLRELPLVLQASERSNGIQLRF